MRRYISSEPVRNKQVRVRLMDAEKTAIQENARSKGMTVAGWLRSAGQYASQSRDPQAV